MDEELRRLERLARIDPSVIPQLERAHRRAALTKRKLLEREIASLEQQASNIAPHIKLRLSLRKDSAGDYRITWREHGKLIEAKTNYTNDLDDAVGTLRSIVQDLREGKYQSRRNPDEDLRALLRRWQADTSNHETRDLLDAAIARIGAVGVWAAQQIRILCVEILQHRSIAEAHKKWGQELVTVTPLSILSPEQQTGLIGISGEIFGFMAEPVFGPGSELRRTRHAYQENMILFGADATAYMDRHGVPAQTERLPTQLQLNIIGRVGNLSGLNETNVIWCYRLFNPEAFDVAKLYGECQGPQQQRTRRSRGPTACGQHTLGCICGTVCRNCYHCTGCSFSWLPTSQPVNHPSECVCDDFHVVAFNSTGQLAGDTHRLGYLCGCRGGGWISTDYDTTHECPTHSVANHHSECTNEGDVTECCARPRYPRRPPQNLLPQLPPLPPPGPPPAHSSQPPNPDEDDLPF